MKKFNVVCMSVLALMVMGADGRAAVKKSSSKQSALQQGTSVRTKTEASGLYDQECYDAYYGCMDQFCITENEAGGSCACSDLSITYDKQLEDIKAMLAKAENIATVEVEKVKAGADADIIFSGKRQYDEDGNIVDVDEHTDSKSKKRASLLAMFEESYDEDEDVEDVTTDFFSLRGAALYSAAEEMCLEQVPESCESDMKLLRNMYSRQITSDCKGFENSLKTQKAEAEKALASAEGEVRKAYKETFDEANKYDLGECMVEFKKP